MMAASTLGDFLREIFPFIPYDFSGASFDELKDVIKYASPLSVKYRSAAQEIRRRHASINEMPVPPAHDTPTKTIDVIEATLSQLAEQQAQLLEKVDKLVVADSNDQGAQLDHLLDERQSITSELEKIRTIVTNFGEKQAKLIEEVDKLQTIHNRVASLEDSFSQRIRTEFQALRTDIEQLLPGINQSLEVFGDPKLIRGMPRTVSQVIDALVMLTRRLDRNTLQISSLTSEVMKLRDQVVLTPRQKVQTNPDLDTEAALSDLARFMERINRPNAAMFFLSRGEEDESETDEQDLRPLE